MRCTSRSRLAREQRHGLLRERGIERRVQLHRRGYEIPTGLRLTTSDSDRTFVIEESRVGRSDEPSFRDVSLGLFEATTSVERPRERILRVDVLPDRELRGRERNGF